METPCYVEQSLALLSGATSQPTCLCCIAQHRLHLSLLAAELHKFLQWNTSHSKAQPKRHCTGGCAQQQDGCTAPQLAHPLCPVQALPTAQLGAGKPSVGFPLHTAGG